MSSASQAMTYLASQLIAIEARVSKTPGNSIVVAIGVCAKLQGPITKFGGPVGYFSLLSRALALAKNEQPSLRILRLTADGAMKKIHEESENADSEVPTPDDGAGDLLIAHLLGLLLTFIGESLMMTLLYDAWPDETFVSRP